MVFVLQPMEVAKYVPRGRLPKLRIRDLGWNMDSGGFDTRFVEGTHNRLRAKQKQNQQDNDHFGGVS